jgi:hypothetical protein
LHRFLFGCRPAAAWVALYRRDQDAFEQGVGRGDEQMDGMA